MKLDLTFKDPVIEKPNTGTLVLVAIVTCIMNDRPVTSYEFAILLDSNVWLLNYSKDTYPFECVLGWVDVGYPPDDWYQNHPTWGLYD